MAARPICGTISSTKAARAPRTDGVFILVHAGAVASLLSGMNGVLFTLRPARALCQRLHIEGQIDMNGGRSARGQVFPFPGSFKFRKYH